MRSGEDLGIPTTLKAVIQAKLKGKGTGNAASLELMIRMTPMLGVHRLAG